MNTVHCWLPHQEEVTSSVTVLLLWAIGKVMHEHGALLGSHTITGR